MKMERPYTPHEDALQQAATRSTIGPNACRAWTIAHGSLAAATRPDVCHVLAVVYDYPMSTMCWRFHIGFIERPYSGWAARVAHAAVNRSVCCLWYE